MDYLHVHWQHDAPDAPADIYSELDDDRWEVRKVEVFPDGTHHYADDWKSTGKTGLSEVPLPPFEDLAAQRALTPTEIDEAEFERRWQAATEG
ncbi:DUF6881 domain-containing protein [Amycolatopsis solani]|uniref:DUF6881 domain-containing protein n=1 Tax=Amycolatopsis solani TaxID=3028615 RepID=UPI0025AF87D7|nr:hypothetical protein [Amycolatopsis sp. MEP2-6]